MAQVLFAWELGGGIGHLMTLRPLAQRLAEAGHRVAFALRDLSRSEMILAGLDAQFFQAPVFPGQARKRIEPAATLAHVLYNTGFSTVPQLAGMVASWQSIIGTVRPDLVVCDHSPAALVASRGSRAKCVAVGAGFNCPPAVDQLPDWRPWMNNDPAALRRDEDEVRDNVNQVLAASGRPLLDRLSDLYAEVDDTLLATVKELDAFPNRGSEDYWGSWTTALGIMPHWPDVPGPRIFAYLKSFPALPYLLAELVRRRLPAIVYGAGLPREVVERFRAPSLVFYEEPLDMQAVASQCDLAILNATSGSVFQLLRRGKPLLNVPLNLEQRLTADQVTRLGAGIWIEGRTCKNFATPLQALISNPQYVEAAVEFASRYSGMEPQHQLARAVRRLEALLRG